MHFAEPGSVVAVFFQYLTDGSTAFRHQRIVPWEARGKFRDGAARTTMMIAPGNQCGSGRRTKRGRMVHVVAQAFVRELFQCGGLDWSAEGAAAAESNVIGENQQNVRRTLRG